jgi:hypothetical protein
LSIKRAPRQATAAVIRDQQQAYINIDWDLANQPPVAKSLMILDWDPMYWVHPGRQQLLLLGTSKPDKSILIGT